jgi:hypothetical protein
VDVFDENMSMIMMMKNNEDSLKMKLDEVLMSEKERELMLAKMEKKIKPRLKVKKTSTL